jgi:hypothetical protein
VVVVVQTAVAAAADAGPALIMAFCAMVKAAGAFGGWTLLTAESARAAAQDGRLRESSCV